MKLSSDDLDQLATVAVVAASEAGRVIARARPAEVRHKEGQSSLASQVVTEVDELCEQLIVERLAPTMDRFELALLSEEREDDGSRRSADYFWCIDPLDGTLPFIEGLPGYSVSVALVGRDGTPWIGVVCDPNAGTIFHAIRGAGVFRNGAQWKAISRSAGRELSLFADRSLYASEDFDRLVGLLGGIALDLGLERLRLRDTAGAVMNACGVLVSAPGCYFKLPNPVGGGSLWDFAATACLFHEAGFVATDVGGRRLDLNRPESTAINHRGVLFATSEPLAARIRTLVAEIAR